MSTYTKTGAAAAALLALAATAYAAKTMQNDAVSASQAAASAKISMVQAITTAEQAANGKATRAEYEQTNTGWAYDVEVVSGAKVFDVRIDADKGTVMAQTEDTADRDDDHDKKD